jgi:hypothetical protein
MSIFVSHETFDFGTKERSIEFNFPVSLITRILHAFYLPYEYQQIAFVWLCVCGMSELLFFLIYLPIPVAARSKVWVCGRTLAGIVGSNHTGGMDICLV